MTSFVRALVSLLTAVGLTLAAAPTPAQAAYGGDCNVASVCLYQWINYGSPTANTRWQSSIYNVFQHPNSCLTLPPATWANGDPVSDNSGSLQFIGNATWSNYKIGFFNWVNCNPDGGEFTFPASQVQQWADQHQLVYPNTPGYGTVVYHTITSIQLIYVGS